MTQHLMDRPNRATLREYWRAFTLIKQMTSYWACQTGGYCNAW